MLVSSFTRAAAKELVSRQLPLNDDQVGTLHALCYRALDRPKLVAGNLLKDWNAEHPSWGFGGIASDIDDPYGHIEGGETKEGDLLLQELNRLRGLRIEPDAWPMRVQAFAEDWKDFKSQTFTMDFTDLIDLCVTQRLPIPHEAAAFFLDEVQDFSPLELHLARWWGESCERLYLVGDPDQCIYTFKGATPDAFLYPAVPADQIRVLGQSYRVPVAVHGAAVKWIEQMPHRFQVDYKPRAFQGEVDSIYLNYQYPAPIKDQLEAWLGEGKTVAFLASCSFFLDPLKRQLRDWGMPFHNPYRRTRGDWNPLHTKAGTIGASERVLAFGKVARGESWWTYRDLWAWAGCLESDGVFRHGAKTDMRRKAEADETMKALVETEDLEKWFVGDETAERVTAGDLEWLRGHLLSTYERPMRYACNVIESRGAAALTKAPQIILGTIHCSPGDEPVLTTEGYVPIGRLDPNKHRLASYMDNCNRLVWGGRNSKKGMPRKEMGYPFVVARNPYDGPLLTITTRGSRTRVTPTHRMQVRFTESFFNKWIVYLMRRGNWWRVGMCTSGKRPYASGGLKGRMSTEQADAGWILGVYETAREAYIAEMQIQCRYGLPGLTFQACKSRLFKSEELHTIHDTLISECVADRAMQLLRDRGLIEGEPLCTRGRGRTNQRGMFLTAAANVIDQYMEIPVVQDAFCCRKKGGNKPTWHQVTVLCEPFAGDVFSLEVLPHHHYISGGAVVHNSVKGGEADIVVLFPDLSPAGYREWTSPGEAQDAVRRMFYVGMTRAKEALYWAQPVGLSIGGYL